MTERLWSMNTWVQSTVGELEIYGERDGTFRYAVLYWTEDEEREIRQEFPTARAAGLFLSRRAGIRQRRLARERAL